MAAGDGARGGPKGPRGMAKKRGRVTELGYDKYLTPRQNKTRERRMVVERLAAEGKTQKMIAQELGINRSIVCIDCKKLNVKLPHEKGWIRKGEGAKSQARNEYIDQQYRSGRTMEDISREFGVSRERVRQILAKGQAGRAVWAEANMIKARSAKAKGARLEKSVAAFFADCGLPSRRQPGSGIYSDFSHDNHVTFPDGPMLIECKARAAGHRTLDRWMGKAEMLVIRADRGESHYYMPERTMRRLLAMIGK